MRIKVRIIATFLILVIPFITFSAEMSEISPEVIKAFKEKFKINDEQIIADIAKYMIEKFGVKNLTEERVIDRIGQKYGLSPEEITKIGGINIKVGTLAPANTPWIQNALDTIVPFLAWESRNVMNVTIYAGGVMGEDTDILRKIKFGQLQGCGCTALGVFSAAPGMSVLTLPFIFRNYEEVDHITKKFRKNLESIFEKNGYILWGLIDTGFFYLYTQNKVASISDLKKMKAVTWFGDIERAFLNEVGINYIPISVPEIVMSLQTGIINGAISPPLWWMGTQAFQYSNYYIKTPLFYSPAAIFLHKKQIEDLIKKYPPGMGEDVLTLSNYIMKTYEKEWNKSIRDFEKKCTEAFKKSGINEIELKDEDVKLLEAAGMRVREKLAGSLYSKELLDKILSELQNLRQNNK
ncbi:MAG TPA: TRAP transporter substrate-binding protein DctP [bacterium]